MNIPPKHIRVWRFQDAPEELRQLSTNGGDEDWLALVPPTIEIGRIDWLDTPTFGCCCTDYYEHPELPGFKVVIGCHA